MMELQPNLQPGIVWIINSKVKACFTYRYLLRLKRMENCTLEKLQFMYLSKVYAVISNMFFVYWLTTVFFLLVKTCKNKNLVMYNVSLNK